MGDRKKQFLPFSCSPVDPVSPILLSILNSCELGTRARFCPATPLTTT